MDHLDENTARWLASHGLAVVADAVAALDRDTTELALLEALRRDGLAQDRRSAVLAAAVARRRARVTWDLADQLLFTREGLEQASDPQVSAWRTRRLADAEVVDLCAGVGGDSIAAARAGADVTAVDLDPARLVLLAHNATVHGVQVAVRCEDALETSVPPGALIHADPGRRRDGRRLRRLADHLPPVGAMLAAHRHAPGHGIVLSPAVDLTDPDLPGDAELEFVQVDGELRETVAWTGALRHADAAASATLLPSGERRVRRAGPRNRLPVTGPTDWLVEVVPAAVRARLHDEIGAEIGAGRISGGRALLGVDSAPPASPWYRVRPVHAVLPLRAKAVRAWLRGRPETEVEFAAHGVPLDASAWWRAVGRPPRGPSGWRIELVRTDDGGVVMITGNEPPGPGPASTLRSRS